MNFQFDISLVVWVFIGGLIALVAYFLNRLVMSVDATKESIDEMGKVFSAEKQKFTDFSVNCGSKHKTVDTRLNEHSAKLSEHDKQLAKIEVKVNP